MTGELDQSPPLSTSWGDYVESLVREAGGWSALADDLIDKINASSGSPSVGDLQTVEKGLRRLAARGRKGGGQYGRWLLRFYGVSAPVEVWARWMGQYHSRFADLPIPLRREQLRLWERPPLRESAHSAWIDCGAASLAHRLGDIESARGRVDKALQGPGQDLLGVAIEAHLIAARLASDRADFEAVRTMLDVAERALRRDSREGLSREDRWSYEARWLDQCAYLLLHPERGEPEVEAALELYERVPETEEAPWPFVCFRRALGRAYCYWKLGQLELSRRLAGQAAEHAGDGGYVRFRIMALNLSRHLVDQPEAEAMRARAARLSQQLEDPDLSIRVARS